MTQKNNNTTFHLKKYDGSTEVELYANLQDKYQNYLRPEIFSVKLVHPDFIARSILVIASKSGVSISYEFVDLDFLGDMFSSDTSLLNNAITFMDELDAYDLIMCTPLFTEQACKSIASSIEDEPF